MINPFRNGSPGFHQLMSTAAYSPVTRSRTSSIRQKGFFYRLANWGEFFNRSSEGGVTIEAEARQSDPIQDGFEAAEQSRLGEPSDPSMIDHLIDQIDQTVQQHLQMGHLLMQQGDIAAAITQYRQVIQAVPQHGEAYQYLAEALTQQGELAEAAYCYRQAIEFSKAAAIGELPGKPDRSSITSESAEMDSEVPVVQVQDREDQSEQTGMAEIPWFEQASFHLQQAIVNCNAGDWQDARTACELAIERLEPEAFTAYLILGRTLQGQGHLSEAERAYHKALTLQPHMAETYARLGSLYASQQRLSDAAQQYQTAIQLDSTFAGAYWKLAEVWQQLDAEAEATACWYQAFRLQPHWANATEYCQLGDRLLKLGRLEAAQDCYEHAIQSNAKRVEAYLGLGTVLSQQGQSRAAIDCYQQVIQLNPKSIQIYLNLGNGLAQLNQWEDTITCFQRVLQLAPDHLEGLAGLRQGYMRLEQWQAAWIYGSKLAELQASSAQNWHQLGDVLSKLHRWSDAIDAYQRAIALEPNFSWSHNNLGDALLHLEAWQDAALAFRTAIALNPSFAWSHYNLGEILAHLQDWDGAIASYRAALHLQPELPHASGRLADALQQRAVADRANALAFYQQAIQQNPYEPEHYHKALELQPDAVELYLGLVEALAVNGHWDDALVCCQIARQLQPDDEAIVDKLKQLLQQRELSRKPQDNGDAYDRWMQKYTPTADDLRQMAAMVSTWSYQPVISIIMPVYDTPVSFLEAAVQSVLDQIYPHWQLCIADDASTDLEVLELLNQFACQDVRIKVVLRSENGHISAASNSALALATGEFVALLDHDDTLAPEALYEVVALLNQHPDADMIYSDEDKLNPQGKRVLPFFKPDWCPDSFLSRMYTCHLGVYRRQLIEAIGGFRLGYEGSQDYDLVLRLTEKTDRIFHIPKVLYHWRDHSASVANNQFAKPYAEEAAEQALMDACYRRGEPAREIVTHPRVRGTYIIRYKITHYRRVSIIIPTRNLGAILDKCLQSIFDKTTYSNYEVVLIDNGSDEVETFHIIDEWERKEPERLKCYSLNIPFNYSTINNLAITEASGDYLLFLNNDVEVIEPDWIEAMVEQAQRPSIGAVGALLLYPDETIQHAGVILGIGGVAGHSHKHFSNTDHGYFSQVISINNYSAVTAACMMCRRSVFNEVGGFNETLAVAFNDVDFCLRIKQLGYQNLVLPHVRLYHHESKSRGVEDTYEKQSRFQSEAEFMKQRWGEFLQRDPCYSPHLSLEREDYSIRI